jgi:DNA-binding CsgD family transcriptional regulator/tetratricopeptide (TPR) repeat protein
VAPEEDNLRQSLEHVLDRGDALALSEMCSSLEPFWLTRCQFSEGRRWLELATARDEGLPAFLRARNRGALGAFILYHGDADVAAPILEEAVALARACGESFPLDQALQALGNAWVYQGEFTRAMATLEEAEGAARALAPAVPHGGLYIGAEICFQGAAARRAGDHATAVARFSEAMPYLRAPGGGRRLGMLLGELGVIQVITGSPREAVPTLVESVALTWDVRDDPTLSRALRGLAAVAAVTDQTMAAARLLGAADAVDAGTPSAVRATSRDRDILEWCLAHLAHRFDPATLDRERQVGAAMTVAQSVALARALAVPVLGAQRVDEIWEETGAPDPGPVPEALFADRSWSNEPEPLTWNLTRREREVLDLLCQRLTDIEIAQALFISPRTASAHVGNTLGKLGATNRREAAAIAVRRGLI